MLPGQSSRGAVLVFGPEVNFAWRAQGIRHIGASKRSFYVAGARNRRLCKFRGRRLWTLKIVGRRVSLAGLRFTWQAQGIRTMDAIF